MSALAAFHAGPRAILVKLNLECWFLWREKKMVIPEKNPRSKTRTNSTKSTHIWQQAGFKPMAQWGEVSALTTAPSPLLVTSYVTPVT